VNDSTRHGFVTLLQGATLALALLIASTSHAQAIAGKIQLGLGLGLISYVNTSQSLELDGVDEVELSTTSFGTLESSTIRLGYGVSDEIVLSLDLSASLQTQSQDDTEDATVTALSLAPVASYVFPGSSVRPFLLGSVGVITASTESGDIESSTTVFGLTGGVGIHWFATEIPALPLQLLDRDVSGGCKPSSCAGQEDGLPKGHRWTDRRVPADR
jgi:hypothetical protein